MGVPSAPGGCWGGAPGLPWACPPSCGIITGAHCGYGEGHRPIVRRFLTCFGQVRGTTHVGRTSRGARWDVDVIGPPYFFEPVSASGSATSGMRDDCSRAHCGGFPREVYTRNWARL